MGTRGTVDHVRMPFGYNIRGLLTPRQHEIIQLALQGYSDQVIADKLNIGLKTIYAHFSAIYNFTEITNYSRSVRNHRTSLIYWYLYHYPELIPTEEPIF